MRTQASIVKELRSRTGASCKRALIQAEWDIEEAFKIVKDQCNTSKRIFK